MVIGGNIPIGCGLSSSSALVISIARSICYLYNIEMLDRQLAKLCQKIENRALGTAGGLLDQYAIILSKKDQFMIIDFKNDSIEYIPAILNDCTWIVVNSQVSRELSESAYLQRVKECKEGLKILKKESGISSFRDIDYTALESLKEKSVIIYNRLCHVVEENQRVLDMKNQLKRGATEKVGAILREAHKSLRYLYEVSCEEIDYMIEMSESVDGWIGGRIMGGGFGGCCIHLLEDKAVEDFTHHIIEGYKKKFQIIPEVMNVTFPGK
jgi:galactokinase